MKYYLAPMEGITGYIYRNAYHTFFHNIDKYFTPFIAPNQNKCFNSREFNDILPEHNQGFTVVPQILTNRAEDFIRTSKELKILGYEEVNLNLGCPSRTVVSKNRGAGFLAEPEKLNRFLETIYSECQLKISIKTRLGKDEPQEFYELLKIYNQYPVEELVIHPRVQKDYYKNTPNLTVFGEALKQSKNPVCYNGDLFTTVDYERFISLFPKVEKIMLGRGILANPGLIQQIKGEGIMDKEKLRNFHDKIYRDYQSVLCGNKNVLFKMKELWCYMMASFPNREKDAKKIKKAENLEAYENAVDILFQNTD
ncbi:MAG: tRNA-dihydrouridine synthase family protein [Acetivibrio sp.]